MSNLPIDESAFRIGHAIECSDKSYVSLYKAKQRINTNSSDNIYYLKEGNVSAHSGNGDFIVFNYFGPEVIGLERVNNISLANHLRSITKVEMHVINKEDFVALMNRENLWLYAFNIMTRCLFAYTARDFMIHQPSAKDTVRQYIKYVWTFPPAQRESISLYSFISSRTYISRSSIHKIISDLEKEGMIIIKRGILINCNLAPFVFPGS